jgi:hypothetical protein
LAGGEGELGAGGKLAAVSAGEGGADLGEDPGAGARPDPWQDPAGPAVQRAGPIQTGLCQREWISHQVYGHGLFGNQRVALEVPTATTEAGVAWAVDQLVERHEVLRTTFHADADGRPVQTAWQPRPVAVHAYDRAEHGSPEEFWEWLCEPPFRVAAEWPVRFGFVPGIPGAQQLIFAVSHLAADYGAFEILIADLATLLAAAPARRAPTLPDPGPQPIDQAEYEQSEQGRQANDRGLDHWRGKLSGLPAGLFPVPELRPDAWFVHALIRSPAADLALGQLAISCAASPSSVFLAALSTALAIRCGQDSIPLRFTWASRATPSTRRMVAALFRDLLVGIDLSGRPALSDVVRRIQREMMTGGRWADVDVLQFRELEARVSLDRGIRFRSDTFVNLRPLESALTKAAASHATPGHLNELLAQTGVSVNRYERTDYKGNLWISADSTEQGLVIFASADESALPAQDVEQLLRAVELILVRAATAGGLSFDEAERLAGGRWKPPDGRWALAEGSWVHLDVIESLLREHPAVSSAGVFADTIDAETRITGYVTTATPALEPADLRDFLLSVMDLRHAAAAPHHFVICRQPDPDGGTGPDAAAGPEPGTESGIPAAATRTRQTWAMRQVLNAGDGLGRRIVPPTDPAQRAMHEAVARANQPADISLADNYVVGGGRLHQVPRVLALLGELGFTGVDPDDFGRPCSLSALATRLRPAG